MTTTKTAQREQAKAEYNAFFAACPSRQLLDRISNKWVVLILCALGGDAGNEAPEPGQSDAPGRPGGLDAVQALRYSELSRRLAGVSQKMLTQTLRALEHDGLLTRTVTPTVPVTVTYALTDLGISLHHLTRDLRHWAQAHMGEVLAHRQQHDSEKPAHASAPHLERSQP
ncbi:helix-turn-helix domain-containing protein [Nocardioides sp. W7]|uniref:winged helix-turn-helix transcriptional regulator n=1 Tax=Nocardioides sp. W7 TaxID=2931390 RepID=UPI001FD21090|nr:helix-turn-helix domain-containing protein [Nocardioides sp. W7]